ncbi:MAG TPA: hypothetical protein VG269_05715 [Tepidisphaeraceae bacterium]|nr:hypothetical protein [Tepidisphaeraceae bacterium]
MRSVNLIPAPRRDAKRLRRHMRWCMAACGACATAVIVAAVGCRVIWGGGEPGLDRQLTIAEEEVRRADASFAAARTELAAANAAAAADRQIAGQPDWSLLLALVADRAGKEVVLKSLAVGPRPGPAIEVKPIPVPGKGASPAVAAPPRGLVLTASGLGKSQPAVTQFVLRLERTGLFARVRLLDTSRESFLADEATAFRLECSLDEPAATKAVATTGDR